MNKVFFIIIFISISSFGQKEIQKNTLYLDQDLIPISKVFFKLKCNSAIFHCRDYDKDSIIESRLHYQFYFGKMSLKEVNDIHVNFYKKSNEKIEKGKTLLIHHYETLLGYEEILKLRNKSFWKTNSEPMKEVAAKKKPNMPRVQKYTKKMHLSRVKTNNRKKYKQIKTVAKKFNTTSLFVVRNNKGYPLKNKYFTWIEDSTSTFQNKYHGTVMILKPNGNYFIRYGHLTKEKLYTILKEDNWSKFYADWNKSLESNSSDGYGIVKKLSEKKKISAIQ